MIKVNLFHKDLGGSLFVTIKKRALILEKVLLQTASTAFVTQKIRHRLQAAFDGTNNIKDMTTRSSSLNGGIDTMVEISSARLNVRRHGSRGKMLDPSTTTTAVLPVVVLVACVMCMLSSSTTSIWSSLPTTSMTTVTSSFLLPQVQAFQKLSPPIHHHHHHLTGAVVPNHGMLTTHQERRAPSSSLTMTSDFIDENNGDNEDNDDSVFYDDFGSDNWIGSDSSDGSSIGSDVGGSSNNDSALDSGGLTSLSLLSTRMDEMKQQIELSQYQTKQNWLHGHWSVRGFSLDPYPNDSDNNDIDIEEGGDGSETATGKVYVTTLAMVDAGDSSSSSSSILDNLLFVGRSDGSICVVKLSSSEYLAYFTNRMVATKGDNGGDSDDDGNDNTMTIKVSKQMKRQQQDMFPQSSSTSSREKPNDDQELTTAVGYDDNHDMSPFDILTQFKMSTGGGGGSRSSVSHMEVVSTTDGDDDDITMVNVFVTSVDGSTEQWKIQLSDEAEDIVQSAHFVQTLELPSSQQDVSSPSSSSSSTSHHKVIQLQSYSGDNGLYLVAVLSNGIVNVLNVDDTSSSFPFQIPSTSVDETMPDDNFDAAHGFIRNSSDEAFVTSAFIDSKQGYLFIGLQSGVVHCYTMHDVTTQSSPLKVPKRSWIAFDSASVTAITTAGVGSTAGSVSGGATAAPSPSSISLVTASNTGGIKQWEIFERGNGGNMLEYWPKISTQKLPKGKPHILQKPVIDDGFGFGYDSDSSSSNKISSLKYIPSVDVILAGNSQRGELIMYQCSSGDVTGQMLGFLEQEQQQSSSSTSSTLSICLTDKWLITNGMEQYVCIHDFSSSGDAFDTSSMIVPDGDGGGLGGGGGSGSIDDTTEW